MSDANKTVIITGASMGLGKVMASFLARKGYNVIGTSRNPDKTKESLDFKMLPLDVTSDESVRNFIELVENETDRIDVLVNNVGEMIIGAAEETTLAETSAVFETNFFGAIRLTKAIIPLMRRRRYGRIINLSSIGGIMPVPYMSSYSASKHALVALSESLMYELAPFGIKVCVLEPSTIKLNKGFGMQSSPRSAKEVMGEYHSEAVLKMIIGENTSSTLLPEAVAGKVIEIIESKNTKFRHQLKKAKFFYRLRRFVPHAAIVGGVTKEFKESLPEQD